MTDTAALWVQSAKTRPSTVRRIRIIYKYSDWASLIRLSPAPAEPWALARALGWWNLRGTPKSPGSAYLDSSRENPELMIQLTRRKPKALENELRLDE